MSKVCKTCRTRFDPDPIGAKVCSEACALAYAVSARGKAEKAKAVKERKADAVKREKLKKRGEWIAEAQRAFNLFVRTRDAGKPCICCGKPFEPQKQGGSADAGHYLSRGAAPHLRFVENNVHAQRKNCNRPGGTTRLNFRAGMIERIGLEAVEALESDETPRKWSIEDLKAIKAHYTAKTKELKTRHEATY